MKKFVWLTLLLLSLSVSCNKEKQAPAKAAEPVAMEPRTDDGMTPPAAPGEEKISCETLFARHGKCIFNIAETDKVFNIPVGDSPKKGAAEPLVTLVEFSEFQCPACKGVSLEALPEMLKKYDGKMQVVFKHFPLEFHELAVPAAIVAEEVKAQKGEEAFWKFHDLIYTDQDKLSQEFLNEAAKKLGVDMAKLEKVLADDKNKHKERVNADYKFGESINVEGTPWIFVNGVLFSPEPDSDFMTDLTKLIDLQVAKAEAAIAAGTPKDKVYTFLVDHGKLVFETPIPKEKLDKTIKAHEKMFIDKCNTKDPQLMTFVPLLTACSKPEIACEAFMQCVQNQLRAQYPDGE